MSKSGITVSVQVVYKSEYKNDDSTFVRDVGLKLIGAVDSQHIALDFTNYPGTDHFNVGDYFTLTLESGAATA